MKLSEAHRVEGDVRVEFRGTGRARFRLQHTRSFNGEPDTLSWSDVTQVSNGALASPEDGVDGRTRLVGVLVDWVEGDTDVPYRRYRADWLRVVPFDEFDKELVEQCLRYEFKVVPERSAGSSSA